MPTTNEVRLAAAALGPLAHHLLVDCAPAESAVTPPLCASLSPSGHVPHTRLFHACGEGGAGTPFNGRLTASALIEWAAALLPTPLTSKAAASAPMDHAELAVVADPPLPPMDALLVPRLERARAARGWLAAACLAEGSRSLPRCAWYIRRAAALTSRRVARRARCCGCANRATKAWRRALLVHPCIVRTVADATRPIDRTVAANDTQT